MYLYHLALIVIHRSRTFKSNTMKKAKNIHWILSLALLFIGVAGVNAQFDDLYFDEAEFESADYTENAYAYEDYDDAVLGEEGLVEYDADEYDEYLTYRENEYEIDAYRYTNRFNNLRYSNFYSRTGSLFNPYRNSFIGDPWGYSAFRNPGLSLNIGFGNPGVLYLDPWTRGFTPYNRLNTFNRFGVVRGGFGFGGFGVGGTSAYYCPPYNPVAFRAVAPTINNATIGTTRSTVGNTRTTVSRSRRTGSTTTSSRVSTTRATNTKAATTRSSSRSATSRSVRSATSRSTRSAATSGSRSSSRRSFTPSRTSSSTRSVRSSRSSRSSSPRSSSSSRRSPR